jgi:predicted DNA-binding transcriptional regulator AlpA
MRKKTVSIVKLPTDLIADAECEAMSGLGLTARTEAARRGDFPRPVNVARPGSRKPSTRWVRGEVQTWIDAKIAERDRKAALEREQQRRDREIIEAGESSPANV